jgi:hypothetical protein
MRLIKYLRFREFEGSEDEIKKLSLLGKDEVSEDEEDFWGQVNAFDGEIIEPISLQNEILVHNSIISLMT